MHGKKRTGNAPGDIPGRYKEKFCPVRVAKFCNKFPDEVVQPPPTEDIHHSTREGPEQPTSAPYWAGLNWRISRGPSQPKLLYDHKIWMGICVPCCAFVNMKQVPLQDSSHWNAFIYSVFSHQKAHKLLTGLHWSLEPGSHAETSACVTSTGLLWTQLCFSQSPQHPQFYRLCLIRVTDCYCTLGTPRAVLGQPSSACALHPLQLMSFLMHERTGPYVWSKIDLCFFLGPDSNLRC